MSQARTILSLVNTVGGSGEESGPGSDIRDCMGMGGSGGGLRLNQIYKTKVVTILASNRAFVLTYLYFTFLHFITEHMMYLTILTILLGVCSHVTSGIFCYVCESVRDFRCLDPFDFQPFPQVLTLHSSHDQHEQNFVGSDLNVFSQLSLRSQSKDQAAINITLKFFSFLRLTAAHSPS